MIAHQWIQNKISPQVFGHREFASQLEKLYPERPQDMEPTFGWIDCTPVSNHEFQEDVVFNSEEDLQE